MFQEVLILTVMVTVKVRVGVRAFQRNLVCSRGVLKFLFTCKRL